MAKVDKAPRGIQRMAFDASAAANYQERLRVEREQKQLQRLRPKVLAASVVAAVHATPKVKS